MTSGECGVYVMPHSGRRSRPHGGDSRRAAPRSLSRGAAFVDGSGMCGSRPSVQLRESYGDRTQRPALSPRSQGNEHDHLMLVVAAQWTGSNYRLGCGAGGDTHDRGKWRICVRARSSTQSRFRPSSTHHMTGRVSSSRLRVYPASLENPEVVPAVGANSEYQ